MTPILDQVTSPSTTVSVSCRLLWRRTYQNNGAIHDEREATAEDVRRWLDAQTAEYRDEALLPFRGPGVEAWKNLCDEYANERDSLKSQLSAALAERDTAQAEVARMNEIDTHVDSVLDEIHDLVWTNKSRGKLDDLPGFIRGLKEAHDAARETIRKQEAERDSRAVVTYSQEQFIERCTEIRAEAKETIRALTEERDDVLRRASAECSRIAERAHAERAELGKLNDNSSDEFRMLGREESTAMACRDAVRSLYEPPRSEEGRPDSMVSDPTPPIRWQCSGCHWGFPGPWLQTCPCCGRKDYWSGSVHPNAPRWIPGALPIPTGTKTPATTEPNNCTVCGESIPVGHAQYFEAGTGKGTHVHCMSKARANATRLAHLTDRERSIVAAAEAWGRGNRNIEETIGEKRIAEMNLLAAIDLPKTPDVPPSRYSQQTKDAHGAVILAGLSGTPEELHMALRELGTMVHCDLAGELRDPHSLTTPDVRREEPDDAAVNYGSADRRRRAIALLEANDLQWFADEVAEQLFDSQKSREADLTEKLRLATEQAEALRGALAKARDAVGDLSGNAHSVSDDIDAAITTSARGE